MRLDNITYNIFEFIISTLTPPIVLCHVYKNTQCVFQSAFIKLILDKINFIEIDLIKIDFEIK